MPQTGPDGLPLTPAADLQRQHAVIRFLRSVNFPRFSMAEGERWSFVVLGRTKVMLEAIRSGQRFEFAGGQGVPGDAEIVYEGPCGIEFSIAAGHLPPDFPVDKVRAELAQKCPNA